MNKVVTARHHTSDANLGKYITGFSLSILLTVFAFSLIGGEIIHGWAAVWVLAGLAFVQLGIQLKYFIHLGHESGTQWNKLVFRMTMGVVGILVGGSLWIMYNLDYHHAGHKVQNVQEYIQEDEVIQR